MEIDENIRPVKTEHLDTSQKNMNKLNRNPNDLIHHGVNGINHVYGKNGVNSIDHANSINCVNGNVQRKDNVKESIKYDNNTNSNSNSKTNCAKRTKKQSGNNDKVNNKLIQQQRIKGNNNEHIIYNQQQSMTQNYINTSNGYIVQNNINNNSNITNNTSKTKKTNQRDINNYNNMNNIPSMTNMNNISSMTNMNNMPNMNNMNNIPAMSNINNINNILPIYQNQILPPSQFNFPNQFQQQSQYFPQTQYPMTMSSFPIQTEQRRTPVKQTNQVQSLQNQKEEGKKIIPDNIIIGKDKRTTLMLRHIPNKYTLSNVVDEINTTFWGKFDYVNLPIDYERKLNLGYAFVNFVDPMHIILFYTMYHNKKWSKYHSDKKMDMAYADKQGKKDINCKDEQTYYAIEDKRFNFSQLNPKLEIPSIHHDFFKKIYPNSVCVFDDKNSLYGDKCFIVKHLGKK